MPQAQVSGTSTWTANTKEEKDEDEDFEELPRPSDLWEAVGAVYEKRWGVWLWNGLPLVTSKKFALGMTTSFEDCPYVSDSDG